MAAVHSSHGQQLGTTGTNDSREAGVPLKASVNNVRHVFQGSLLNSSPENHVCPPAASVRFPTSFTSGSVRPRSSRSPGSRLRPVRPACPRSRGLPPPTLTCSSTGFLHSHLTPLVHCPRTDTSYLSPLHDRSPCQEMRRITAAGQHSRPCPAAARTSFQAGIAPIHLCTAVPAPESLTESFPGGGRGGPPCPHGSPFQSDTGLPRALPGRERMNS